MGKAIDLTGRIYGKLAVIELVGTVNKKRKWLCRCDCGGTTVVSQQLLTDGRKINCGCERKVWRKRDLTGKRFERLTVVGVSPQKSKWECVCDCGKKTHVNTTYLLTGEIKSCGCYRKDKSNSHLVTHGLTGTRLYRIWQGMLNRCRNSKTAQFKSYGGRGISVCEEWNSFDNFYKWSMGNGYSDDLSIDRININGNYDPCNCRWATRKEQARNTTRNVRIKFNGKIMLLSDWLEILNDNGSYYRRISRGMNPTEAIFDMAIRGKVHPGEREKERWSNK